MKNSIVISLILIIAACQCSEPSHETKNECLFKRLLKPLSVLTSDSNRLLQKKNGLDTFKKLYDGSKLFHTNLVVNGGETYYTLSYQGQLDTLFYDDLTEGLTNVNATIDTSDCAIKIRRIKTNFDGDTISESYKLIIL